MISFYMPFGKQSKRFMEAINCYRKKTLVVFMIYGKTIILVPCWYFSVCFEWEWGVWISFHENPKTYFLTLMCFCTLKSDQSRLFYDAGAWNIWWKSHIFCFAIYSIEVMISRKSSKLSIENFFRLKLYREMEAIILKALQRKSYRRWQLALCYILV